MVLGRQNWDSRSGPAAYVCLLQHTIAGLILCFFKVLWGKTWTVVHLLLSSWVLWATVKLLLPCFPSGSVIHTSLDVNWLSFKGRDGKCINLWYTIIKVLFQSVEHAGSSKLHQTRNPNSLLTDEVINNLRAMMKMGMTAVLHVRLIINPRTCTFWTWEIPAV